MTTLEALRRSVGEGGVGRVVQVELVQVGARVLCGPVDTDAAGAFFSAWIGANTAETCAVLVLDNRRQPLACEVVGSGGLGSCPIDPRVVFRCAVRESGAAIYVSHNHPSGDPRPSDADIGATVNLASAGRLLGVDVLDHFVVAAGGRWASLFEYAHARAEARTPERGHEPIPRAQAADALVRCAECGFAIVPLDPSGRVRVPDLWRANERGFCSTACRGRAMYRADLARRKGR